MRGTRSPGYLAASAMIGVAALTALAGCKSGEAAASHAKNAVASHANGAVSQAKAHSGQLKQVGPEKPGVPGVPSAGNVPVVGSGMSNCNSSDLAKSFVVQGGDPAGLPTTDGVGMLVITNRSAKPCVLQGYAGVAMVGQKGQHIGLQDVNLSTANGSPAKVDLASGGSAYQGADFASVAACPAVADVQIAPPGQKTPSEVPLHYANGGPQGTNGPLRVCPGVLNVGPLSTSQAQAVAAIAHHVVSVPAKLVP
jgi:Protein of unknown function (DUF4232)